MSALERCWQQGIDFLPATGMVDLEKVFLLRQQVYSEMGYVKPNDAKWLVDPEDAKQNTVILLAKNAAGEPVATVTLRLVMGSDKMPTSRFANANIGEHQAAEVVRLALAPAYRNDIYLITALINMVSIYARRIMSARWFLIEVHPRHEAFYRRLMSFERPMAVGACDRAQGSPAVKMRMDLKLQEQLIQIAHSKPSQTEGAAPRTLYSRFLPLACESRLAAAQKGKWRPLNQREKHYFRLTASQHSPTLAQSLALATK